MKKLLLLGVFILVGSFAFAQDAAKVEGAAATAAWDAALKAIDQNGDGKCSPQECNDFVEKAEAQMVTLRQQVQLARFLRLDQNQDGVITKEELPEDSPQISNLFNRFDADKDGKLDQEELKNLVATVGNRPAMRQERGNRGQNADRPGAQRQQQQRGERGERGERRQRGQNAERRGQRQQAAE